MIDADLVKLAVSFAIGLVGAGGTWAVVRYKVDRTERAASAAHKRLDDHHERIIRIEAAAEHGGKRIEDALSGIRSEQGLMRSAMESLRQELSKNRTCPVPGCGRTLPSREED